ncbi:MAG: hypothetical protein ACRDN0_24000 [Trebonia sp.]
MRDHADIIEFTDSIFDTVDAKDWDAAEKLFAPMVDFDFTSLNGGEPGTITNVQLVDGRAACGKCGAITTSPCAGPTAAGGQRAWPSAPGTAAVTPPSAPTCCRRVSRCCGTFAGFQSSVRPMIK